jgi:SpoVK/Ycf46/Vps4 family AAA+-type ATPase
MSSAFIKTIAQYLDAGYPLLAIKTHEESRICEELASLVDLPEFDMTRPVVFWSQTLGFTGAASEKVTTGQQVLESIIKFPKEIVVVLKDFHGFITNALIVRMLRDMISHLEEQAKMIIFLSPVINIPVELEKDITLLSYALPTESELGEILDHLVKETEVDQERKIKVVDRPAIIGAAKSLTASEAKNAFALALSTHGGFNETSIGTVQREKAQALRKTNLLTWISPTVDINQVGGLQALKRYAAMIMPIFHNPAEALKYGMLEEDFPRSVALVGMPGCGKSMSAKAIARLMRLALIQSDFGKIFAAGSGRVGAAEGNIILRNELVEAMAPCCDWWDEAEKGLAGVKGSDQNPWEARVGATLLTWFEEFRARILVLATINRQEALPPEMISRFQKVFFVDLPHRVEKIEIIRLLTGARNIELDDDDVEALATEIMLGFSGREIRNAVQGGMQLGFSAGKPCGFEFIRQAARTITPLSKSRQGDLDKLKEWADVNKIEPASDPETPVSKVVARRVKIRE